MSTTKEESFDITHASQSDSILLPEEEEQQEQEREKEKEEKRS